jgi:hypothetical protein
MVNFTDDVIMESLMTFDDEGGPKMPEKLMM